MGENHSVSFPENSINNNYNLIPVITLQIVLGDIDGKYLFFSSRKEGRKGVFWVDAKIIERKIWYTMLENGKWTKPEVISFCKEDSNEYNNFFITPDGKKLFLTSFRSGAVFAEQGDYMVC